MWPLDGQRYRLILLFRMVSTLLIRFLFIYYLILYHYICYLLIVKVKYWLSSLSLLQVAIV